MVDQHIDDFIRSMFSDAVKNVLDHSRDKRAEMITEVDGRLEAATIELANFNWNDYPSIVAISFLCDPVLDDPDDFVRYLFLPKAMAFRATHGKQGSP